MDEFVMSVMKECGYDIGDRKEDEMRTENHIRNQLRFNRIEENQQIMNDKMGTNNWPALPPFVPYDDQRQQQALQPQQPPPQQPPPNQFELDMNSVRTNPPPMMPFLPRFGLHLPEFDYRMNEFSRVSLFGACSIGSQFPTHPLTHTFNLGATTPVIDIPPPPLLANQSTVIQRVPMPSPHTSDKPPVLSAEFSVEKSEENLNGFDISKPPHFSDDVDKMAQKLNHEKLGTRIRDELFLNTQFYPPAMPIDMTASGFMKNELNMPLMDSTSDFSRQVHPMIIKKDYSPLHDCQVCLSTHANGLHFGARTCAACAAFFRRTISDDKRYVCKRNQRCQNASRDGTGYRKICRSCRMKRCLEIGMLPENVQHKRTRRDMSPHRKIPFDNFFPQFYTHIPRHSH